MNQILISAGFGFFGGIVRALVGILKHGVLTGKEKFSWKKILFTIIASGIVGIFAGLMISEDYRITMLAGYAGTDLIEGVYKAYKGYFGLKSKKQIKK